MIKAIGEVQINGQPWAIVDPGGAGGYINGIYARYLIVPFSNVDKQIEDIRDHEPEKNDVVAAA